MNSMKELRKRLRENIWERETICKEAGLTFEALKRKLYNPGRFTFFDIIVIKKVMKLSMDETIKIFVPRVAKYNNEGEE